MFLLLWVWDAGVDDRKELIEPGCLLQDVALWEAFYWENGEKREFYTENGHSISKSVFIRASPRPF